MLRTITYVHYTQQLRQVARERETCSYMNKPQVHYVTDDLAGKYAVLLFVIQGQPMLFLWAPYNAFVAHI